MDLKVLASWATVIGTCLLTAFFFGFLAYHCLKRTSTESSWFLKVLEENFAATIVMPLSAMSSVSIVILLGTATGGDLSFEAGFLSFKGASGPVTLWLVCFVAMIAAAKLLWNSKVTATKSSSDNEGGANNSMQLAALRAATDADR
jgi:hypothetical protein